MGKVTFAAHRYVKTRGFRHTMLQKRDCPRGFRHTMLQNRDCPRRFRHTTLQGPICNFWHLATPKIVIMFMM